MDRLENDTRDIELTPEFIGKSDKDIGTISSLNEYAKRHNMILVLTGGYASEALCGGKIARPHGDIDARLLVRNLQEHEAIFSDIKSILDKEATKWSLRQQGEDKLDYLEEDPKKEFFERRRVELKLRDKGNYRVQLEDGTLVDSHGFMVKVKVFSSVELISGKIHKFYAIKDGVDTSHDRHSSESDYFDLNRLVSLQGLDKQKVVDTLAKSKDLRDLPDAHSQAIKEYDYTIHLLTQHFGK